MAFLEGVLPNVSFTGIIDSLTTWVMLACIAAVFITIIFVFVFTKRFGYYCHIYSQRGSGKVLQTLKARKIGKPGEVEKLYIMATKETIPMPDGNFVYPFGKYYVINFYRNSSRELIPAQLATDDEGNIYLKTNEQDIKFWYINQTKERKGWEDVKTGLAKYGPMIGIIFLALCFVMFLFYSSKVHSEDTAAEYAFRTQVIAANERLIDRLDAIAPSAGIPVSTQGSMAQRQLPNG